MRHEVSSTAIATTFLNTFCCGIATLCGFKFVIACGAPYRMVINVRHHEEVRAVRVTVLT